MKLRIILMSVIFFMALTAISSANDAGDLCKAAFEQGFGEDSYVTRDSFEVTEDKEFGGRRSTICYFRGYIYSHDTDVCLKNVLGRLDSYVAIFPQNQLRTNLIKYSAALAMDSGYIADGNIVDGFGFYFKTTENKQYIPHHHGVVSEQEIIKIESKLTYKVTKLRKIAPYIIDACALSKANDETFAKRIDELPLR